jgi:hypothetical protein
MASHQLKDLVDVLRKLNGDKQLSIETKKQLDVQKKEQQDNYQNLKRPVGQYKDFERQERRESPAVSQHSLAKMKYQSSNIQPELRKSVDAQKKIVNLDSEDDVGRHFEDAEVQDSACDMVDSEQSSYRA